MGLKIAPKPQYSPCPLFCTFCVYGVELFVNDGSQPVGKVPASQIMPFKLNEEHGQFHIYISQPLKNDLKKVVAEMLEFPLHWY